MKPAAVPRPRDDRAIGWRPRRVWPAAVRIDLSSAWPAPRSTAPPCRRVRRRCAHCGRGSSDRGASASSPCMLSRAMRAWPASASISARTSGASRSALSTIGSRSGPGMFMVVARRRKRQTRCNRPRQPGVVGGIGTWRMGLACGRVWLNMPKLCQSRDGAYLARHGRRPLYSSGEYPRRRSESAGDAGCVVARAQRHARRRGNEHHPAGDEQCAQAPAQTAGRPDPGAHRRRHAAHGPRRAAAASGAQRAGPDGSRDRAQPGVRAGHRRAPVHHSDHRLCRLGAHAACGRRAGNRGAGHRAQHSVGLGRCHRPDRTRRGGFRGQPVRPAAGELPSSAAVA